VLPDAIVVRAIEAVDDAFDPRRHARSRLYEYRIWTASAPSPFWRRYAWHRWCPLDFGAMAAAATTVLGTHDFRAFCASDTEPVRSTERHVYESGFERRDDLLVYRVEANAFLKHMVRNLMGTFVEIGRRQRSATSMAALLAGGARSDAGAMAPAHGLILKIVRYETPPRP
jgi:tRNA pseudouridine38-40 synthase